MGSKVRLKVMAFLYVVFWIGAFGVVIHSRAVPAHVPLSEVTAFAAKLTGQQNEKLKESSLFVTLKADDSSVVQITPVSGNICTMSTAYQSREAEAIQVMLQKYKSPMAPFANVLAASAEKYGIDYRIEVSIAMVESGAGKVVPGDGKGGTSYNAWGWRDGESYRVFDNWPEGIEYIAWRLAEGYGRDRLKPKLMEESYCPPCAQYSPGEWARGVEKFMKELDVIYKGLDK